MTVTLMTNHKIVIHALYCSTVNKCNHKIFYPQMNYYKSIITPTCIYIHVLVSRICDKQSYAFIAEVQIVKSLPVKKRRRITSLYILYTMPYSEVKDGH